MATEASWRGRIFQCIRSPKTGVMKGTAHVPRRHGDYRTANKRYWTPRGESSSEQCPRACTKFTMIACRQPPSARSIRRVVFLDRVLLFRLRDGDLELGSNLGDRLAQRAELRLIAATPCRNE